MKNFKTNNLKIQNNLKKRIKIKKIQNKNYFLGFKIIKKIIRKKLKSDKNIKN
jgi:hypothetical protein